MTEASEQGVMNQQMNAAMEAQLAAVEAQRPSVLFRPRLYIDGNAWCALYGGNIQNGLAGFGPTADAAMRNFDIAWTADKPAFRR